MNHSEVAVVVECGEMAMLVVERSTDNYYTAEENSC